MSESELTVPRRITTAELLAGDTLNDDDTLRLVRNARLTITDKLLEGGIPTDKDSFEMLSKNLAELDKSALKSKGLAIDESNAEANAKLAAAAAETFFKKVGSGKDPFLAEEGQVVTVIDPVAEIQGTGIPVPGELKVGDDTKSYDEFMKEAGEGIAERVRSGELSLKDL
jgi:hypothetical protein